MKTYQIKSIDPIQLGKILGVLYFIIGAIVLVPLGLILSLAEAATGEFKGILSGFTLVFIPFLYAFIGFVGGIILAFVYNLIVKMTGGIKLEMEIEEEREEELV